MDGPFARPLVVGTAHRLAVNGHHLSRQQAGHRPAPFHETLLEAVRVQTGEHIAESVVGRYSLGKVKEGAEPVFLAPAEHLHVDPRVGTADDGADGYGDDVQQLVPLAPVNPGILQSSKTLHDRAALPLGHSSPHHPAQPPSLNLPSLSSITRLPCRRRRFGCGRSGGVVASIGCSFSGVGFLFQNHYPRSTGAPSYRFRMLTDALLRWIRAKRVCDKVGIRLVSVF